LSASWLDELDEAGRLALDELLLRRDPVPGRERPRLVRALLHQALQRGDRHAGEGGGGLGEVRGRVERARVAGAELAERGGDLLGAGHGHADARHAGVERELGVEVVQAVGDEEGRERHVGEGCLAGEVAQERDEAALLEAAAGPGDHLVGAAHDEGDALVAAAPERPEVREVPHPAAHELERGERLARKGRRRLAAAPLPDPLRAAGDVQPVPEVVAEHHRERGEQLVLEPPREVHEPPAHHQAVVDVPVQHELPVRAALVGERELRRPGGGARREGHPQPSFEPSGVSGVRGPIARAGAAAGAPSSVMPSLAANSASA
jgi:hypothetical protein